MEVPLVSIVCVTFNHASYIRQALDGFLFQRTTFPFEVILHDDASKDDTAAVVREYAERHPELFVLVLQTENQYSQGRKPWGICFPMARGKYIALCEGDDYWTDPQKLQKQVDVLEADPTAVACFTNAVVEEGDNRSLFLGGRLGGEPMSQALTLRTFIEKGQSIPVCTVVFRVSASEDYRPGRTKFPAGDTILFAHLLRHGHFLYLTDVTGVYRMHTGGIYSMRGQDYKLTLRLGMLDVLERMFPDHGFDLTRRRLGIHLEMWAVAVRTGDRGLGRKAWRAIRPYRAMAGWNHTTLLRNWCMMWAPFVERAYTRLTQA